jgi:hypothetical protein
MKRCTRCILPETFPGIEFDDEGVCQYCRHMPPPERRVQQRAALRVRFEQLVAEVRGDELEWRQRQYLYALVIVS